MNGYWKIKKNSLMNNNYFLELPTQQNDMVKRDNTLRSQIKRKCWNCRYWRDSNKYGDCPSGKIGQSIEKSCKAHKFDDFWVRTNL